eukprot:CAMPEP_0119051022 /NCGR_PEP_ID=MMETSP1177-20130426/72771_1 /TAXON_ID=2985 /ORGANISM="Ochromonas sp, Strain CCMP1899" /LENGTH=864 /DNA_ID=CAMNT_0007030075 /DNA_START=106 /DNA_END=2697 /DNA_ORIENTATION=-
MGCTSSQFEIPYKFKHGKFSIAAFRKTKNKSTKKADSKSAKDNGSIPSPNHSVGSSKIVKQVSLDSNPRYSKTIERNETESKENDSDAYKENALIKIFERSIEEPDANRKSTRTPLMVVNKILSPSKQNMDMMNDFDDDVYTPEKLILPFEELKVHQPIDVVSPTGPTGPTAIDTPEVQDLETIDPIIPNPTSEINNTITSMKNESVPPPITNRLSKKIPLTITKKTASSNTTDMMNDFDDDEDHMTDFAEPLIVIDAKSHPEYDESPSRNETPLLLSTYKPSTSSSIDGIETNEDINDSIIVPIKADKEILIISTETETEVDMVVGMDADTDVVVVDMDTVLDATIDMAALTPTTPIEDNNMAAIAMAALTPTTPEENLIIPVEKEVDIIDATEKEVEIIDAIASLESYNKKNRDVVVVDMAALTQTTPVEEIAAIDMAALTPTAPEENLIEKEVEIIDDMPSVESELVLNKFQQFIQQDNEDVAINKNISEPVDRFQQFIQQESPSKVVNKNIEPVIEPVIFIPTYSGLNEESEIDNRELNEGSETDNRLSIDTELPATMDEVNSLGEVTIGADFSLDSYKKRNSDIYAPDSISPTERVEESENTAIDSPPISPLSKYKLRSIENSPDSSKSSQRSTGSVKTTYAPNSTNSSYKDKQNEYMKERTDFLNKVKDDIQVIEDNTNTEEVASVKDRISRIQSQRKQQEDTTSKTSPGKLSEINRERFSTSMHPKTDRDSFNSRRNFNVNNVSTKSITPPLSAKSSPSRTYVSTDYGVENDKEGPKSVSEMIRKMNAPKTLSIPGIESGKENDSPGKEKCQSGLTSIEKYQVGLTSNRSERLSLDQSSSLGKKDTELGVKKLVGRW